MNKHLAQVLNRNTETSRPIYREISMFGIEMNSPSFGVRDQLLTAVRRWLEAFRSYQPNRTYMRGAGPACEEAARRQGGGVRKIH